ncbi:MAG TPA: tetratricopeptide repeat protein [Xanthomonadaceae bacterium]|nr:tetratricopeptide repeat protein [Xanthomonadaceae bacterium]
MSPEAFHFLRPLWLLGLAALPVLLWLGSRPARDVGDWRRVVDPDLLPYLVDDTAPRRRGRSWWWTAVVWTIACLALAGPAWERIEEPAMESAQARALVLSLSDTMLAGDLRPDRLTRARLKLADLIAESRGQHLGLVVYAGDAFTVAPLTDDGHVLAVQLDVLHPDLMPLQGARADLALHRAAALLRDAGFPGGEIVLLTDHADSRAIDAAAEVAAQGMRVSVLGFGTAEGAPIPRPEGGFRRDAAGNILLPRFDTAQLASLARAGRGTFLVARGDRSDVMHLVGGGSGPGREGETLRVVERYLDRGPWLALALLPLALVAWRRGLLLAAIVLLLPQPALAFGFRDLWQRQEQQAHAALEQGDHARARALAADPARRGSAAFREQDYEAAAMEFAAVEGASGRYNLGNALAMGGRYQEAIAAYEEALALDPGLDDARANLEAIREWLEQQPEQPGDGGQDDDDDKGDREEDTDAPSQGEEGEPEDSEDDGSKSEQQPGGDAAQDENDKQRDNAGPPDGESEDEQIAQAAEADQAMMDSAAEALARELDEAMQTQQEQEAAELDPADREAEEQRQMVEQWLRRVPDDPGALLRRKFAVEHRRRQAEGGQ